MLFSYYLFKNPKTALKQGGFLMTSINITMDIPNDDLASMQESTYTKELEVIPYVEPTIDPSKTGNKPKKLIAVEVMGYEIGRGLRKKVVNPDDVYRLAAMGCNDREIAIWFDVDENTLKYNFSNIIQKGREDLKHSLRRAMLKNAMNGNAAIQIFLAKNLLGMSDNPIDSEANTPLPWDSKDD